MSSSSQVTRVCGCMGCTNTATQFIDHHQHGVRAVCETHAASHQTTVIQE